MPPLKQRDAQTMLLTYLPAWKKNRDTVEEVDRWYRGDLNERDKPSLPKKATKEYRDLRSRSSTPWLKYVVNSTAQGLYVEGYRRSDQPENASSWKVWQANGMDARQIAIHRGALAHALSYAVVLPGDPLPVIRGHSARGMVAFYQDVAQDDWPMAALRGDLITDSAGKKKWRFRLYDETAIYMFDANDDAGASLTYVTTDEHNAGVCPIVRFANTLDLDGRAEGEVQPYIDIAARIDQDTFDRLVVQRFGAWMIRYIAGMVEPETDEEKRAQKLRLSVEDVLVAADPDTKFGAFPATPLDGYIKARDSDIRDLAVVTQTPPQDLLGQMINLSAEALAAAEAGRTRRWQERKHTFGESHEQMLRMAAHLMGDTSGAGDFSAQVIWRDMESRSLAQAADALGKIGQMLGIPAEILWEKIPGFTQQDVERAKELRAEGGVEGLLRELTDGKPAVATDPAQEMAKKAEAMGVLIRAGASPESAAKQVGLEGLEFTGAVPVSLRLPERDASALEDKAP
jgi:SPP1 Gp6-like portal protein